MNRASDVSGAILLLRQNIDDLRALGDQFSNFEMIDDPHR